MKTKFFSVIFTILIFSVFIVSNTHLTFATGITRVQGNATGNTVTANSITVTMAATPTSGNVLIATIGTMNIAFFTVNSITETNVAWTKIISRKHTTYINIELWLGVVSNSASTTVTIALSGKAQYYYQIADICEYSGIKTNPTDKTAVNNNTASTSDTGTTATTTQNCELWVGSAYFYSGTGNTAQTNATNSFTLLDGSNYYSAIGGYTSLSFLEKIVFTTGTANSGTVTSYGEWFTACIATFIGTSQSTSLTLNGTVTEIFALTSAKTIGFTIYGLSSLTTQILSGKTVIFTTHGLSSLATQILSGKTVIFTTRGLILEIFIPYLDKTISFSEYGQNTINFVSIFGRSENLNIYNIILTGFGISSSKAITFNPSGLILETFSTVGSALITRFVFLFGKILFDTSIVFTNYYWLLVSFAFDYSMLIVLLFLLASNIVLCIKRVPIISFVIGAFSFAIGVYEVNNTTIPANPLFSVMLCIVGIVSILINTLDMKR